MPALIAYYHEIGLGKMWQVAFQDAFGLSVAAFYAQFEQYRKGL